MMYCEKASRLSKTWVCSGSSCSCWASVFFAFAGQDERGLAACGINGLQVAQAVSDQPGFGGIGLEAFDDVR